VTRKINRLSARSVATIAEHGRRADGGGLYLSISPNGGRRWVFLFRWRGKPTEIGFGSARDVSLARARQLASQARAKLAEGINPKIARRPLAGVTFGECADRVIEAMRPSWRNRKHAAQWVMTLKDYAGPLRCLPVDKITTDDVLSLLKPLWNQKQETASRLRGRIERVLDAARAQGLRNGENPAAKQQTIKLEEGATVKLDPNSSVRVVGDLKVDMPQPSKRQLQEEATTRSNELPITSYTIFKSVPYSSGAVDTGWHFDLSDPVRPTGQYCYYRQDITKGLTTKYMLAVNNSPRRPQPLQKLSFDFDEALSNCVWYSGF
jgi:hypothetical protein